MSEMGAAHGARELWREQQRAKRLQDNDEAKQALIGQQHADLLRRTRANRPPPVSSVTWQGVTWTVLNLAEAQARLAQIRHRREHSDFHLIDQSWDFPDPEDAATHAVFLMAEEPVVVSQLTLMRTLPGHANLRIHGWICGKGLEADHLNFSLTGGAAADEDEHVQHRSCLVVDGPARLGLAVLPAGRHAFTGEVHCRTLACAHYSCNVVLAQRARIDCLINAGAGIFCHIPPQIRLHVADDVDPDRSSVTVKSHRGYRVLTPTHRISEVVAPEWLRMVEDHGPWLRHDRLDHNLGPKKLLRSEEQIARAYAGFPAMLADAFEQFSHYLQQTGMKGLQAGGSSQFSTHARYHEVEEMVDGTLMKVRVLVRHLEHSGSVRLRAIQRVDTAELRLALEDIDHAGHVLQRAEPRMCDETPEAHMVKHGLAEAIRLLRARYKIR